MGFTSQRILHVHFLLVYTEWCAGHQSHTSLILMELLEVKRCPLDSYSSQVEPLYQRIQTLGCDVLWGKVWVLRS